MRKLRILMVEDSPNDAELVLHRLREAGMEPLWDRVQTEAGLRTALAEDGWDIALIDYNLPGFGGLEALGVLADLAPDLPAITVSGTIGEEVAVATITAGAVDYMLKDNLTRLVPAIESAVEGAELRRARRQATEEARQSQFAVDHATQAILYVGEDGGVLYVNRAAERLVGIPREEVSGRKIWDWSSLVDERRWTELWQTAARRPIVDFEAPITLPNGETRLVSATLDRLRRDEGDFMVIYARDITEERALEERSSETEARYQRLTESLPDIIFRYDLSPTFRLTYINSAVEVITGYSPEECYADPQLVLKVTHSDDVPPVAGILESLTLPEEPLLMRLTGKDGATRWMESRLAAVRGSDGRLLAVEGIARDVSERKRVEDALRASEQRFVAFADHVPGRLWIRDRDLRYLYVNPLLVADLGGAETDYAGKTPEELWDTDTAAAARDMCRRALDGEVVDVIERWPDRNGSGFFRSLTFSVAGEGDTALIGGLMFDVTEQHATQEDVRRHAERLRRTLEGVVMAMSHVAETRDPYTAGHERRVSELAVAIGEEMGLAADDLDGLRMAGLIHDIGKITVPAEILSKPGRLSSVEFRLIKQHAQAGFDILQAIAFERPVAQMVLQHHERRDGSGYPQALSGEDILLEARMLAAADVVEAMSSHRPYRAALGIEPALAEIRENAGSRYDPDVAAACERVFAARFTLTD